MSTAVPPLPSSYAVQPTDRRVLVGLEPLPLVGRSSSLPPIYCYVAGRHPQLPLPESRLGKVYVYLVDSSPTGRSAFHALASSMEIPGGMTNQPEGNPGASFPVASEHCIH